LAQRVDRAMNVGVGGLVVARHGFHHRARLLAGGGGVQIDERVAVDDPRQDREVAACLLVESHASALPRTVSGSVTQRIRVGRTSACSTVSTSAAASATASEHAW